MWKGPNLNDRIFSVYQLYLSSFSYLSSVVYFFVSFRNPNVDNIDSVLKQAANKTGNLKQDKIQRQLENLPWNQTGKILFTAMKSYTEWKTFQSYLILSLAIIEGFIYVLGNIHTTRWNHWSFSICVWGRLDQANHMISWRSRVQKAPFSSVHEKTESWRFQIPCVWRAFSKSSVFVTDNCWQ